MRVAIRPPLHRRLRPLVGALLLSLGTAASQAALFEDEEARKAIVDLRARVTASEEANRARLAELASAQSQMLEQLAALRRSLLELNNQLETLRADVARLRGADEQLAREVAELQRRQKDLAAGLDERLRGLEPLKLTLDGTEITVAPAEKQAYDEAMAVLRGGDFDKADAAFAAFLRRFPGSGFEPSVRFWQGNALYGKRDYKEAITAFRAFVAASPRHPRAPEALLALANSQAEMKDVRGARKTIDDLIKAYPQSEAAQAGKDRLKSLR